MNPLLAKKFADVLPTVLGVSVAIGVPFGTAFLVKNYVRTSQKNTNYSNATDAEKPEFYAIQFENSLPTEFYDFTADEEEIYRLLRAMPNNDFFSKVNKSYQRMVGRTLMEDLKMVGSDDYKIVIKLIQEIPN
ncbi:hypothetical protein WAF17_02515 [Bernardetia sp. ABR2-2B]|uniref:hypothetical protein n=1 Tax=Bernardetia sp. ABR2-2B TaxID=3127472 RepID=UPI0030CF1102